MKSKPLSDAEIASLQAMLDALPPPLEPLDIAALDGFLVGVLLQPQALPPARWLPHVIDVDGRAPPPDVDLAPLQSLVLRRHAELDQALAQRQWFDPWVYELDEQASPVETVMPWVAGFATAMALFPALMAVTSEALIEPLAVLFAYLDADDLEDADDLLAVIETLEPPSDLTQAVEDLVRSSLLLADVVRPPLKPQASSGPPRTGSRVPGRPPRKSPGPGRR